MSETKIVGVPRELSVKMEPPIYLELDRFSNTLASHRAPSVEYSRGFLYSSYINNSRMIDSKKKRIIDFADVSRTVYTHLDDTKVKNFLVIMEDGKPAFEDVVAKCSYNFVCPIIPIKNLGSTEKVILDAIAESYAIENSKPKSSSETC
jgi:hypothetical protein